MNDDEKAALISVLESFALTKFDSIMYDTCPESPIVTHKGSDGFETEGPGFNDHALTTSRNGNNKAYVKDALRALQKLEEGTYGFCDECEEPIDHRRIEKHPYAVLCVSCKTTKEQQKKLRGGSITSNGPRSFIAYNER